MSDEELLRAARLRSGAQDLHRALLVVDRVYGRLVGVGTLRSVVNCDRAEGFSYALPLILSFPAFPPKLLTLTYPYSSVVWEFLNLLTFTFV